MYSKEFMKFLFCYQKEDFSAQKEPKSYEIRFKNNNGGKPVEVYVPVENK